MDSSAFILGCISFTGFLMFQARGIAGGDSGDLVTAATTFGVAHPPGYPLYTFFGWVASHIPFFTPAWRVGLLSSLPHAVVIALVYMLVSSLTKRKLIGLFSALLLFGNYLFFLYSVTPEVFGLFDLFVIVLVYLLISRRSLALIAFVFGLSLTHHHVILFLMPACIYWFWANKTIYSKSTNRFRLSILFWFLVGLTPYAYVFIAARGHSIINWDRAVNLAGFIRLVTRADYGTFVSGGLFGSQLVQRFLQIQAYAQFILLDFTWIGIVLIIVGLYSLWMHNRRLCIFFILSLIFLGPFFFFYASFPLMNRFTLGTYERFLLPSYVLYAILVGVGLGEIARLKYFRLRPVVMIIGYIVLLIYPLSQLGVTLWRFYGLPSDRTADNLGRDILSPLPPGSILLLGRDTTLFSTQYVRYALFYRPDIIALHASRLDSPDYKITLNALFPKVTLPVTSNYSNTRIFSTAPLNVGTGWYWVPYGLTYELVDEKRQPSPAAMYRENLAIWKTLHDPTMGILARYNHMMLSDVRDVYAGARIALGTTLLRAGELEEAYNQFSTAAHIAGDIETATAYTYEGLTRLFQKDCTGALHAFTEAKNSSIVPENYLTFYEGVTYRDCVGDSARAQELLSQFQELQKKEETPLN
jgi:Protein of unknown function (DUF2723)